MGTRRKERVICNHRPHNRHSVDNRYMDNIIRYIPKQIARTYLKRRTAIVRRRALLLESELLKLPDSSNM